MKKNKVAFVMSARFPTEKAYGVTNRESILELIRRDCNVRIFSRKSNYTDDNFAEIEKYLSSYAENYLHRLLIKLSSNGNGLISKSAWKLGATLILRNNLKEIKHFDPSIIWTREVEVVRVLIKKFPASKIILEVHSKRNSKRFKKFLKHKNRILFCPINGDISDHLRNSLPKECHIQIAPMSVNPHFISSFENISYFVNMIQPRSNKIIEVGYVGKFSPGGYSKGIETLFKLASFYQRHNHKFRVNIIGGSPFELAKYSELKIKMKIQDHFLVLSGHVPYFKVPEIMRSMDVLVLPNPLSEEYDGTPLKLLEYLAVGRIVLIADVLLFTKIFSDNLVPFTFQSEDEADLAKEIELAIKDQNLKSRLINGVIYSSKFTWEQRTSLIVRFF